MKNLSWQLLHSNYRLKLGKDGWDRLARECGAPDLKRLDANDDVPMEPFNKALLFIDRELGAGDGALIAEIAEASVVRWGNMFRNLVKQLRGNPQKMLEIFCTEVHPYFLNDPGASAVVSSGPDRFVLKLDNSLEEGFKRGLVEGFVALTGADAVVERRGDEWVVTWQITAATPRPSKLALFTNAVRAPFLTATFVPVLLGTAVAANDGFFAWDLFLLVFVGSALMHLGINVVNDYFDHRSGVDEANLTPTPFSGGSRVIQRGFMSPRGVLELSLSLTFLGVLIGLYLAFARGWEVLAIGLTGFLLGTLYTMPPVRLAHRGFGEVAVFIGFGPVIVLGAYFVQAQAFSLGALWASLPVGALIAGVLYINQFPDKNWDAKAGKRNLVVRLSDSAALSGYLALMAGAYVAVVAGVVVRLLPLLTLIALLTIPLLWKTWQILKRYYAKPYHLIPANAYTVMTHLFTGLLLVVGYAVTALFF